MRISCSARRRFGGRGLAPKRHAFRREGACPRGSGNTGDRHRQTAWRSQSPAPLPSQDARINRNAYYVHVRSRLPNHHCTTLRRQAGPKGRQNLAGPSGLDSRRCADPSTDTACTLVRPGLENFHCTTLGRLARAKGSRPRRAGLDTLCPVPDGPTRLAPAGRFLGGGQQPDPARRAPDRGRPRERPHRQAGRGRSPRSAGGNPRHRQQTLF